MSSAGNVKRLYVLFSGRVQGVGFRFAVNEVASRFTVAGIVRNLPDGDVELIAEGEQADLVEFLNGIRNSRLRRNIFKEQMEWQPATGEFDHFGIGF